MIFKKKIIGTIASVTLAYLFCQPSKWFGLLAEALSADSVVVWIVKILVSAVAAIAVLRFFSEYIAKIFSKNAKSVLIFSCVPLVYYVFDYLVSIYTDTWNSSYRLAAEFLPFSLCVFFILFCIVYYKEYERKIEAENNARIVRMAAEQQAKEIETIKRSNIETSLLRHDMRHLLGNLALCIEQDHKEQALKMISGFASQVEAASVHRYCKNDTLNYILTNFEAKCKDNNIEFSATVEIEDLSVDETLFSSIISNALDNAVDAQAVLLPPERHIKLMLKNQDGKLLLSVKNPFKDAPSFVDGYPVTDKKDHGYGTQSIRYMTERLSGKCRFSTQDNIFILRVVI
ncbi:MAG: sensor histidine kinase [Clostridia bacterium]|nr:sensor histidine kinase [Clostridia bacterium]